jgi:hypothetical protein
MPRGNPMTSCLHGGVCVMAWALGPSVGAALRVEVEQGEG